MIATRRLIPRRWCLALFAVIATVALAASARAAPSPLPGRVVWLRGDRAYLALADSSAPGPGALLAFVDRGKTIARGEIARAYDGDLIVARITSGTLAGAKKLERVQILIEYPPILARTALRVGCPAGNRTSLLFACDPMAVQPPSALAYRAGAPQPDAHRWFRATTANGAGPWPDTLEVQSFDDIADEEIALERGEIDAAIFWPGEVSPHMREQPLWQDHLFGMRMRGVVAALGLEAGPGRDSSALAAMNQDLFQSDLAPWRSAGPATTVRGRGAPRFQVDPSCPGAPLLERYLGYSRGTPSESEDARSVRVFYLDAPVDSMARLVLAVTRYARANASTTMQLARADSLEAWIHRVMAEGAPPSPDALQVALRDALGASLLFSIRCPVLSAPRLRAYMEALGADALVNMLHCASAEHP